MQAEAERLSIDPPQRTRDARACQFAGRGQARSIDLWLSRLYGLESIGPHSTPKNRSAVDRATSKPSKRKVSIHSRHHMHPMQPAMRWRGLPRSMHIY